MTDSEIFQKLGIALALGLLVGLQRERVGGEPAGIRTFALITTFGAVCALFTPAIGGWMVVAGLGALTVTLVSAHWFLSREQNHEPHLTTLAASLLMYCVGAYLVLGSTTVAVALGGTFAVLLHLKQPLHQLAAKIGDNDFKAIMQFVVVSLVILPVLPNQTYGPYQVLNPFQIWLMVVLIVGIGVGGFVAYKFLGRNTGSLVAGVIGGLISSTATTVSYSRQAKKDASLTGMATLVILLASCIVFFRVLLEIAIVNPDYVPRAAGPLGAMLVLFAGLSLLVWRTGRRQNTEMPEHANPSDFKMALLFGLVYAVVLLAVSAAKENFGDKGLYVVALLSGLHDMDAITLSTAELVRSQRVTEELGWRVILAAAMSNLVFKTIIAAALGGWGLLRMIAPWFGLGLAGGAAILIAWPL